MKRVLSTLAVLAAIMPAAVWVVMRVPGEDWWVGAALVYAPKLQWVAVPGIGCVLAVAARRWRLVALNLAAGGFALFMIAGFQINDPAPLPDDRSAIRVATWNVYGWTRQHDLVRDRIMAWDCDVVCLQETARPAFRNFLPGYESVRASDLRIFVRGRILSTKAPPDPITGRPRMLLAEVETDAGRFHVINLHIPREERQQRTPRDLDHFAEYVRKGVEIREAKFDQLLDLLPAEGPVIIAGDMNTPPASRYHAAVARRLTDSFKAVGFGFGHTFVWQRQWPLLRIDYIWTGGGAEPLTHQVRPHEPSDHRPIVADVALPAE